MREPREDDFIIPLPGVGDFRYGRRRYIDKLRIRSLFVGLVGGLDYDPDTSLYAGIISSHNVLCVEAPKGWEDIGEVDVDEPGNELKIIELFGLLTDKEAALKTAAPKSGPPSGEG